MPRPLGHVRLALVARVEALLAAPGPARGGEDAHGLGVLGHEAAHIVVVDAAVAVGLPTAENKVTSHTKGQQIQFLFIRVVIDNEVQGICYTKEAKIK